MMWTDFVSLCERLSQFLFLAAIIFSSQAMARRAQDRRVRRELRRVRVVLRAGLRALHELYSDNLGTMASGETLLLSGRNQIALLRIHFGRLVSLEDEAQIEAVLAANIAMEAAEAAMAVAGKPMGAVGFTLPEADGAAEAVKLALLRASAALATAEALLAPSERRAAPARAEPAAMVGLRTVAATR